MSTYGRSVVVWTPSASKENQGQQEFVVAVEKVDSSYSIRSVVCTEYFN
jgi:hypothetical protein